MPTIPVGFAEATFVFQCTGRPKVATWSLGIDSEDFSEQTPADIAENVFNAFGTSPGPYQAGLMDISWRWVSVEVTMMYEEGPLVGGFAANRQGTNMAGAPPTNCAVLMNKQTNVGGRRNRGRAFLPPVKPGEADIDPAGVISGTQLTALQTAYDGAFAALPVYNMTPVLFHGSAPFTPTPITGFAIQSIIATQRRRLRS